MLASDTRWPTARESIQWHSELNVHFCTQEKKLHDFHPSVVVGKINIMIGLFVGVRVFLLNCLVGRETHCLLCRLYTILMMHMLFYLHLNFATTPTSRHISESSFAQI
jgi:hypothetical protein